MLRLKKYPKTSRYWYVRGTIAGQRVFESTGTIERTLADEYRRKRESELYRAAKLGQQRPVTFSEAALAYVKSGGEGRYIGKLMDHFKDRELCQIGQKEADEAAAILFPNRKPATLNRQLYGLLIAVMRYALRTEMSGAVYRSIKMRAVTKSPVTPAPDEHLAKLLKHCPTGLAALILLMTYTGLRTGEALRVRAEDVRDGYIHIAKTKNGEARMVPVPDGWRYPSGGFGFKTTQGVGKALRRASSNSGIPYMDGHQIGRHAFAARCFAAGMTVKEVQEAGGWKKAAIVADTYGHLEISKVHKTVFELSKKGLGNE